MIPHAPTQDPATRDAVLFPMTDGVRLAQLSLLLLLLLLTAVVWWRWPPPAPLSVYELDVRVQEPESL